MTIKKSETVSSKFKWSKFYWSDWRNDVNLQSCSLSAQGLWINILALMHSSERIGYLEVSKRAMTAAEIARLLGLRTNRTQRLLDELEKKEVFSRDERGVIYSRRIIREEIQHQRNSENGKKGGNPLLKRMSKNGQNRTYYEQKETKIDSNNDDFPYAEEKNALSPRDKEKEYPDSPYHKDMDEAENYSKKLLWSEGILKLQYFNLPEKQARALIGKWLKMLNHNATVLYRMIDQAYQLPCENIISYIQGAIRKHLNEKRVLTTLGQDLQLAQDLTQLEEEHISYHQQIQKNADD